MNFFSLLYCIATLHISNVQDGREGICHPSNSEVPREVDLGLLDDFISADVVVIIDEVSLANSWLQHGLLF